MDMDNMLEDALISAVHNRPALFDKTLDNYSNRSYVNRLWKDIANELGLKELFVRKKWTRLRDYFQRSHRQLLVSSSTRPGSAFETTKKWYLYDKMSFLLPFIVNRSITWTSSYLSDNDNSIDDDIKAAANKSQSPTDVTSTANSNAERDEVWSQQFKREEFQPTSADETSEQLRALVTMATSAGESFQHQQQTTALSGEPSGRHMMTTTPAGEIETPQLHLTTTSAGEIETPQLHLTTTSAGEAIQTSTKKHRPITSSRKRRYPPEHRSSDADLDMHNMKSMQDFGSGEAPQHFNEPKNKNRKQSTNEDEHYCLSLVSKMESLDPIPKMQCQMEIHGVIIKYLQQNQRP